jgi:hypothetical protein
MAAESEMKRAKSKSESESESNEAVGPVTLEDIVRLMGKDPLVAFAEAAGGRLECTECNGLGYIERESDQQTIDHTYTERTECKRCRGTRREKVPATALLNARYKLARFFYGPRKAVEMSEPQGASQQHVVTVEFVGRDEDEERERG